MIEPTVLPGVLRITPPSVGGERNFSRESWNRKVFFDAGLNLPDFVWEGHVFSAFAGTLNGLHFEEPPFTQEKLVCCGRGSIFNVAVDVRRGSPTYAQWCSEELSFANGRQMWIPSGFLHGFLTLEPHSEVRSSCTAPYISEAAGAVHWDSVGIGWPLRGLTPILSEKDAVAQPISGFQSPFVWEIS